ncbi:hypothetical protein AcV5_004758 [Taiwanofungus camphoratus]|nr:hypothetical protein AcW2_000641 [Antrodia cinnamomea]KAI0936677.1 hypothetical protein AcV5_004758 [Antrodia cinnamomea]
MLPLKRRKLAPGGDVSDGDAGRHSEFETISRDGTASENSSAGSDDVVSPDTEDEIAEAKWTKSKKTSKRKRRATDTTHFGATLQSLLSTDAPSALPLSLKPSVERKRKDEKLELKGKRVLQVERKEKEDKGRIRDVIGGWGGESERTLRKVAQRGVVKLFNVIQQSQAASSAVAEELKAHRGSGKPTLPAPTIGHKSKNNRKGKQKDSLIGQGKEASLDKDKFLDIIRSGGIVSKV